MLVPFNELSKSSKVWIYQASKELTDDEITKIKEKLEKFLQNWQSHGKDLVTSYQILYNQFIILAIDEDKTNSSGCSIDASVAVLKELEQDLQVDLFNRMLVMFKINDNINTVNLQDFKRYVEEGKIDKNTTVFNNLVATLKEFESNWETAVQNSWHKRFLN